MSDVTSKWLWELPELTEDPSADDELMLSRTSVVALSDRTKRIKKSLLIPGQLRIYVQFSTSGDGPWANALADTDTYFRMALDVEMPDDDSDRWTAAIPIGVSHSPSTPSMTPPVMTPEMPPEPRYFAVKETRDFVEVDYLSGVEFSDNRVTIPDWSYSLAFMSFAIPQGLIIDTLTIDVSIPQEVISQFPQDSDIMIDGEIFHVWTSTNGYLRTLIDYDWVLEYTEE